MLDLVADVTDHLRTIRRASAVRARSRDRSHPAKSASPLRARSSGYGPDFGSIPDFTELPNGVRSPISGPDRPPPRPAFKAGDILTEFDGKPIQNLYDFTYALTGQETWPRGTCESTTRGPNN